MRLTIVLLSLIVFLSFCSDDKEKKKQSEEKTDKTSKKINKDKINFERYFKGYKGCLVFYDKKNDRFLRYNDDRCDERFVPCSTFKIYNSLIGLQTGILKDEKTEFKWDKTKQPFPTWEKDHTLETAIQNSVVWYYKRLAEKIGKERMQMYIDKLNYGNHDISAGITKFWLSEGSLKISANEQLMLIKRLYEDNLPFDKRVMDIVKRILIQYKSGKQIFSGKTGSSVKDGKWLMGWFVGRLKTADNEYFFAINYSGEGAKGSGAKKIIINILKEMELM